MVKKMTDNTNTLPKRGASLAPRTSKESTDTNVEEVINAAPLANPNSFKVPETQTENTKPWRTGTTMSEDELAIITKKDSFNIPMELSMRLDFILSQKKAKALGRKNNRTTLLIEALDDYTKRELKKLGYTV